jgi:hypothetical protein
MIIQGVTLNGVTVIDIDIVTSGLQLYLDANNPASYPGTGTTWFDLSGQSNDVVMQNSGSISYTSSGGGYFSTGATGYFNKASGTNIPNGSTPYTVSAWVQLPSGWPGGSNSHTIIQIGSTPTYNGVNGFVATSDGYLGVGWFNLPSDPGPLITNSWTPSSPGTNWMNVVSQWDGSTRNIWYNGVLQATDSVGTLLGNNSDILIGLDYSGFGNYLIGNIGQALIYNRALTPTEIQQNYTAVRSRYGV